MSKPKIIYRTKCSRCHHGLLETGDAFLFCKKCQRSTPSREVGEARMKEKKEKDKLNRKLKRAERAIRRAEGGK